MMKNIRETASVVALGSASEERDAVKAAFQEVQSSFENFCLLAGIEAFQDLLEDEAADLCGERHQRHEDRRGRRWGKARSPVAFHGGRVDIERPRVRTPDGQRELELPSLAAGQFAAGAAPGVRLQDALVCRPRGGRRRYGRRSRR